ncbi:MAG: hypothetical protein IJG82_02195, partial [Atopobiaceae bacterium]|nr:hypothetical protein [Atopobiaceae bacterium]
PAMAQADVGIAMGAAGSAVALETADVALMSDDLGRLPFAVRLSRQTSRIIRQNLIAALGIVVFLVIGIAEALHHIPGLDALNAFGFSHLPLQLGLLAAGVVCYIALTGLALKSSAASFEETDL